MTKIKKTVETSNAKEDAETQGPSCFADRYVK